MTARQRRHLARVERRRTRQALAGLTAQHYAI